MLTISVMAESRPTVTSLHQPVAHRDVAQADDEKHNRECDENEVEHGRPAFLTLLASNTRM
jgi:hypothetical protein